MFAKLIVLVLLAMSALALSISVWQLSLRVIQLLRKRKSSMRQPKENP